MCDVSLSAKCALKEGR